MLKLLLTACLLTSASAFAQVAPTFSPGETTYSPAINGAQVLPVAMPTTLTQCMSGTRYLQTATFNNSGTATATIYLYNGTTTGAPLFGPITLAAGSFYTVAFGGEEFLNGVYWYETGVTATATTGVTGTIIGRY